MNKLFENWRKTLNEGNLRMAHVEEVYPDKSSGEQTDIFEKYSKCSNVNNAAELRDVISGEIKCERLNEEMGASRPEHVEQLIPLFDKVFQILIDKNLEPYSDDITKAFEKSLNKYMRWEE